MKDDLLKKVNFTIGKFCRIGTRQMKLSSIRRQRKRYLQNLGERLYVYKVLQKEDDVWDKDEIAQLLLTLADLDQEQELLLQEISDIKTENLDYAAGADDEEIGVAADKSPGDDSPVPGEQDGETVVEQPAAEDKKSSEQTESEKTSAATRKSKSKSGGSKATRKTAAKSKTAGGEKSPVEKDTAGEKTAD